ncbi:magnesium transporter CorA family protein [Acetobacter oeni]|uniref:Magnesium transport protein CorA n=1 Tax=Acetobacter oeni TaxID=304077 RepID=A0A511XK76_9PROT|nr:magnesium transporter CorA family protein [Acetobacter oeni]MBB3883151.1 magnesium transporter [Acetobacter oeni]NHO19209.1 magnesium transporter [Acetobacter oeni]GBR05157.1 magnesium/cobalt transporter CorA [Acetobacter oeni LMG 21952]GEN63331.1 magnesium transport protein CorA [Acetobacter oeni]
MFLAHRTGQPARAVETEADAAGATWLDLIDPTDAEHALATKIASQDIPRRANLDEIESSSRLFTHDDAVYLSTPLVRRTETELVCPPIGFVLTPKILISVRFSQYASFDIAARQLADSATPLSSDDVLILLLEAIVDRLADVLEHVGLALNQLSRDVFAGYSPQAGRIAAWQRAILRRVGHSEDFSSLVRDSLLGLDRIAIFVSETTKHRLAHSLTTRLATVNRDIASLNDFVSQQSNKVQFLLDAALGFISIEQNDGMKILTVVSFIGVAPTLIAGVYGMNFKDIPELTWSFGYWYALTAMASSVILPLLWFWRRGWLGEVK